MTIIDTTTTVAQAKAIGGEGYAALVAIKSAKAIIKAQEAIKSDAEKVARDALGTAIIGTYRGVEVVKVAFRERNGIDSDLLKTAFPEAYAATRTHVEYSFLNVL